MEDQAECMLVLIAATPEGRKELVGFQVGVRESAQSWRELLVDVKRRGLSIAPEIAVGDGAQGASPLLINVPMRQPQYVEEFISKVLRGKVIPSPPNAASRRRCRHA
ncbi:hypothetical protein FOHLNKBM_6024 [Methylobacterium longum]|nr:hypothetical protein FOHLNKBM_6024 [Methylobacterium longum]